MNRNFNMFFAYPSRRICFVSIQEQKSFDERFIRMDTKRLGELTSAADSLQLKPLVDLTSRALARIIEGKTPEEIRETFHLPDDLTEEEKLEPLRNITDDPRIRQLIQNYQDFRVGGFLPCQLLAYSSTFFCLLRLRRK